jgi:hypothetical protein
MWLPVAMYVYMSLSAPAGVARQRSLIGSVQRNRRLFNQDQARDPDQRLIFIFMASFVLSFRSLLPTFAHPAW